MEEKAELVLVGNKCDLGRLRNVSSEACAEFARRQNVAYCETSAKLGTNIEKVFLELIGNVQKKMAAISVFTE